MRVPVDPVMVAHRCKAISTRSIKTTAKHAGLRLALSLLDLTTLEGKDSPEKVRALCRKAQHPDAGSVDPAHGGGGLDAPAPPAAAVCVYPSMVPVARDTLGDDSPIAVASVATAFPSGQFPLDVRLDDVRAAIAAGADEIDMVINRGAFLAGDHDTVAAEIRAVREVCRTHRRPNAPAAGHRETHLKIILETGELETLDNVRAASDLAIRAATVGALGEDFEPGSVFIKTSTGKVSPAATMPVTLVMLEAIRDHWFATGRMIGMKPAGGIRTAKQALHYLVLVQETLTPEWLTPGLFRFGASSLADDVLRQLARLDRGRYAAAHDFPGA